MAGLFRGGGPTVVRAMALNMGMLASNDQAKEMIEGAGFEKGGRVAVIGAAAIAGVRGAGRGRRSCLGSSPRRPLFAARALPQARQRALAARCAQARSQRPRGPTRPSPPLPLPPGFFASACSLPFDFIKTRMQKMTPNADGTMPYKGSIDCAMQTLRSEGPLKFYTGFPTFCLR